MHTSTDRIFLKTSSSSRYLAWASGSARPTVASLTDTFVIQTIQTITRSSVRTSKAHRLHWTDFERVRKRVKAPELAQETRKMSEKGFCVCL